MPLSHHRSSELGYIREDDLFHLNPAPFLLRELRLLSDQRHVSKVVEIDEKRAAWQCLIGFASEGLLERPSSHVVLFEPIGEAAIRGLR